MIKAVIFDCFGVLTTDGWLAFREKYFGDDQELFEQGMVSNKRVDAGLISYQDFIREIAELAGVSERETLSMIEGNIANEQLFEYIRDTLRPGYKIGMLSNAGEDWRDRLFAPWQNELIENAVFSYELNTIKPDKIMYDTIADRLGVLTEECVFIDDQPRYVEGAVVAGMHGIHFDTTNQVIISLDEMLRA